MNFHAKSGVCSSKNGLVIALGTKEDTYGRPEDEPIWWGNVEGGGDWKMFRGPSYHSVKISTGIIEAILSYYNINVKSLLKKTINLP